MDLPWPQPSRLEAAGRLRLDEQDLRFRAIVRGGVDFRDFKSRSSLGGLGDRSNLARGRAAAQVSFDLPLGRSGGRSSTIGKLSANLNFAVEQLSDAGTLRTFGYGITWSPVNAVGFIASFTEEEGAPTLEQLGGPMLFTPNVRTFDIGQGEVVDVTRVSGGIQLCAPMIVASLGLG